MTLIFATYDVEVAPETVQHVLSIEKAFSRYRPTELIIAMFNTVRRFHPGCRTVILTDQTTQFSGMPKEIEIVRHELDTSKLTMSRTIAQIDFLKKSHGKSNIVFLDTDMLFQGSLEDIFQRDFDVGLTYREHRMPINGGMILINCRGYAAACQFMTTMLGLIQNTYTDFQAWYGSQFALKDLVDMPETLQIQSEIVNMTDKAGTRLLLLPCSIYNFTPDAPELMDKHYPGKIVLHFKGPRKSFMLPYYDIYLDDLS